MAVANVACLLAQRLLAQEPEHEDVLIVDWDLEAPGLHRYFNNRLKHSSDIGKPGLIDLFLKLDSLIPKSKATV